MPYPEIKLLSMTQTLKPTQMDKEAKSILQKPPTSGCSLVTAAGGQQSAISLHWLRQQLQSPADRSPVLTTHGRRLG